MLAERFPDVPARVLDHIHGVTPFTMTSAERLVALCDAVSYLVRNGIEGAMVECGVWRGGSMMAVAQTLLSHQICDRDLWLYDTFEGMSEPGKVDVDLRGAAASRLLAEQDRAVAHSVWCRSPLEEVRQNLQSTGYPQAKVRFVEGKVEETIPQNLPETISLLRLDTDWYESTKHELEHLWPRLVPGGVLIIDDYGHWQGCRRAVDEFFSSRQIAICLCRIDYTGRMAVKPAEDGVARTSDGQSGVRAA
jgi:O-methyltransferase